MVCQILAGIVKDCVDIFNLQAARNNLSELMTCGFGRKLLNERKNAPVVADIYDESLPHGITESPMISETATYERMNAPVAKKGTTNTGRGTTNTGKGTTNTGRGTTNTGKGTTNTGRGTKNTGRGTTNTG